MIKLVLTGIWVCAITLASVYFSVEMATAPVADPDAAKKDALELVRGESITVPIISNGAVSGYFLGRISFMMNKEMVKDVELPLTELTTDELFTLLVGNKMIDFAHVASFDVKAFRDQIKTNMNQRMGGDYISDVLVEKLDYLARDDIRPDGSAKPMRTGKPVTIVGEASQAAPAAAAGH